MGTFCTRCGNSIDNQDKFCRACGAPSPGPTSPGPIGIQSPNITAGSAQTSPKAILSLVFGIFIFFFPLSLAAVILGHLSLSEIRRSAGRVTGEGLATAGLVLGYIGVAAIPIMLIIAAIAIPNLLRARMAANESSAVASVRTIVTAEMSYSASHPESGYACSLSALSDGQTIDHALVSGQKNGYRFQIMGCEAQDQGSVANQRFQVVAYPITANQTGMRAFCSDESAVIKQYSGGSAQKCLDDGVVLQ